MVGLPTHRSRSNTKMMSVNFNKLSESEESICGCGGDPITATFSVVHVRIVFSF